MTHDTITELAKRRAEAHEAEQEALAALRAAARELIPAGKMSELGFARLASVDRMTVRHWLGKR